MHFKFFNHVLYSRSLSQYSLRVNGLDAAFIYSALMLSKTSLNVTEPHGRQSGPLWFAVIHKMCSDNLKMCSVKRQSVQWLKQTKERNLKLSETANLRQGSWSHKIVTILALSHSGKSSVKTSRIGMPVTHYTPCYTTRPSICPCARVCLWRRSIDAVAVVFIRAFYNIIHEHTAAGGGLRQSRV